MTRISSLTKEGIPELWEKMLEYETVMTESGEFEEKRRRQHTVWMWSHIKDRIMEEFLNNPNVQPQVKQLEAQVKRRTVTPGRAADLLIKNFFSSMNGEKDKS